MVARPPGPPLAGNRALHRHGPALPANHDGAALPRERPGRRRAAPEARGRWRADSGRADLSTSGCHCRDFVEQVRHQSYGPAQATASRGYDAGVPSSPSSAIMTSTTSSISRHPRESFAAFGEAPPRQRRGASLTCSVTVRAEMRAALPPHHGVSSRPASDLPWRQ